MSKLSQLKKDLRKHASPQKAEFLKRFFKTGRGEYGENDILIGVTVPNSRAVAKKYNDLSLQEIKSLLKSKIHEERLTALFLLVNHYEKNIPKRKEVFDLYLANTQYVNNWDLVDSSAHKIVGHFLYHMGKDYPIYKTLLKKLAQSKSLWEKRIAIIATYYFIKQDNYKETLHLAEILLDDKHDLMHKAVGWMLREVGNRSLKTEEKFLKKHYKAMPRTMLRYAIEKFPENKRQKYLKGKL